MKRRIQNRLLFLIVFSLFQKGEIRRTRDTAEAALDDQEATRRIRCPKCNWEPNAHSRWYCGYCPEPEQFFGGCGAAWNTFDTAGLCPGCGHQWRWTACLRCGEWSLHTEWYEDEKG